MHNSFPIVLPSLRPAVSVPGSPPLSPRVAAAAGAAAAAAGAGGALRLASACSLVEELVIHTLREESLVGSICGVASGDN